MTAPRQSAGERGMILVIVLWTVAMMSVVAVALSAYVQRNIGVAGTEMQQLRSEYALRSALNAAAAVLWAMKEEDRAFLYGDVRTLDLGGGLIAEVKLTEQTGKADLNAASPELLRNLFAAVLESEQAGRAMADAVVGLRGEVIPAEPGSKAAQKPAAPASSVGAASTSPGGTAVAPRPPGNVEPGAKSPEHGPVFQSPLQLAALPGIGPEDVNKVLPFVGVVSRSGRLNPLSAPLPVLKAVPKITGADLAVILAARKNHDARGGDLRKVVETYGDFLTLGTSRAFQAAVRIVKGPGVIAGSRGFATILLTPDGAKPFQVLALSW